MKKLLIAVAIAGIAAGAQAQMLSAGTRELKVEGVIDFESSDDTVFDIGISYGHFLYDYIEGGVALGIRDSESETMWTLGVFGERNFDLGTELVPYLGLGLSYADFSLERNVTTVLSDGTTIRSRVEESENAFVLSAAAGAKFFIAENIALSGALVLEAATEEIYPEDDELKKTNAQIELGMRFFF